MTLRKEGSVFLRHIVMPYKTAAFNDNAVRCGTVIGSYILDTFQTLMH